MREKTETTRRIWRRIKEVLECVFLHAGVQYVTNSTQVSSPQQK